MSPSGKNLQNLADHLRCTDTVKDKRSKNVGQRCTGHRQRNPDGGYFDKCAAHRGVPQQAARRSAEDRRIRQLMDEQVADEDRSLSRAQAHARQLAREEHRARGLIEWEEHRAELDNVEPEEHPLVLKLERILSDPTTRDDVRRAVESKLEEIRSGKARLPEPVTVPGPEWVPPEEFNARLRSGHPYPYTNVTDYRVIENRPDPHAHRGRRRSRSRWQDIPLVGDRS